MAYGIVSTQSTAGSSVLLGDVSGASAIAANQQVSLKWADPDDVSVSGSVLAHWDRTIVVRKAGSAPTSYTDGTVVVSSTVKNQYSTTAFVDTGLVNGTTYHYRFFPVSKEGSYKTGSSVSARPSATSVTIPAITGTYTYNGKEQSPAISNFDNTKMTKTGDLYRTDAGTYSITIDLSNDTYMWSDGSYAPKVLSWTINKATGAVSLNRATVSLTSKITSATIPISQVGDGELTVSNVDPTVASAVIKNGNLIVSRVGSEVGSTTVTVTAAASTNYKTASAQIVVSTSNYSIMTVTIDESNSNPETCCAYADDALNMEAGSDLWDTWFGHYPVLFKDGAEVSQINPNNFNLDSDNKLIDITSGDAGDVMIAFPRMGLKMSKSGDIVTISMTDNPDDPDFEYMAHKRGGTLKDKFYIGAYMGSTIDSKLRSLSGKTPEHSKTIGEFRDLAQANGKSDGAGGSGYDQHGFYQLTYLIAMYVLKYKNLNSQAVIGWGYTQNQPASDTGGTETKGMDYGTTDDKVTHMKLFGIEDLWGNLYSFIDGFWHSADYHIWTATENFNDNGTNYTDRGASGITSKLIGGYYTAIQGDTHKGFITKGNTGGSSTTYYCDQQALYASRPMCFGGTRTQNFMAGIFYLHVYRPVTYTDMSRGSRLMYL